MGARESPRRYGGRLSITKMADTTIAAAVAGTDVPQAASGSPLMRLPVVAGRTYLIRGVLVFQSDTAGEGFGFGLTHPGATVYSLQTSISVAFNAGVAAAANAQSGCMSASGQLVAATLAQANTDSVALLDGIIVASSSGYVTLQQNAENAVGNRTVRQGSYLELEDVTP